MWPSNTDCFSRPGDARSTERKRQLRACGHLKHIGGGHCYPVSDLLSDREPARKLLCALLGVEDDDSDASAAVIGRHEEARVESWQRLHRWGEFLAQPASPLVGVCSAV